MKRETMLEIAGYAVIIIMILWFMFSCFEVSEHNLTDQVYSKFNIIVMLYNLFT